jgi:hypothetical protein
MTKVMRLRYSRPPPFMATHIFQDLATCYRTRFGYRVPKNISSPRPSSSSPYQKVIPVIPNNESSLATQVPLIVPDDHSFTPQRQEHSPVPYPLPQMPALMVHASPIGQLPMEPEVPYSEYYCSLEEYLVPAVLYPSDDPTQWSVSVG